LCLLFLFSCLFACSCPSLLFVCLFYVLKCFSLWNELSASVVQTHRLPSLLQYGIHVLCTFFIFFFCLCVCPLHITFTHLSSIQVLWSQTSSSSIANKKNKRKTKQKKRQQKCTYTDTHVLPPIAADITGVSQAGLRVAIRGV
jgi:hypothetical protein